eukprot:symbB.v1.2.002840.t1/scaffold144.1/size299099/18
MPTGEGAPVAMFSARFDGGPIEQKMRRVHKILVDNSYNALMVQVDAGESFGVLTARYLNKLKVDNGLMIAVCTKHYGEMTSSKYCSYYELKFAVTHGITVLPLRVEDTYPPQPPCGKDHLDKECDAEAFIAMTIGPDVLYVDCRTMSEMAIARAIATRLCKLRDERQVRPAVDEISNGPCSKTADGIPLWIATSLKVRVPTAETGLAPLMAIT